MAKRVLSETKQGLAAAELLFAQRIIFGQLIRLLLNFNKTTDKQHR